MKIFLLLSGFLFFSCTTIKQLSSQKITTNTTCSSNNFNEKMIYLKAKVDYTEENFLFDTGAAMSVITDSSAITKIETKIFGNFGTVTGADKKTIDLKTFTAKFESDLFYSENKAFAFVPRPVIKCQQKEKFKGIIGLDVMFNDNLALQLDFSNNKICNITQIQINKIKDSYTQIKSECKSKQIFIFLTIENKEYRFKFDTGFSGSLSISYNEKLDFSKYNSLVYIGNMFRTATSTSNGEESFYENIPLKLGVVNSISKILVSKTIKSQNIGNELIKQFDWIIDYNNNKVFLRKNANPINSELNRHAFQYLVSEKNDKLLICTKQKQLTNYNLDDQITSVNNQQVTPENICEMQNLLNKTQDWSTLKLEVIPVLK